MYVIFYCRFLFSTGFTVVLCSYLAICYGMLVFNIYHCSISSVPYKLLAEYIIAKSSAYSIRDDNQKIPIDCGKYHVKHDITILLT